MHGVAVTTAHLRDTGAGRRYVLTVAALLAAGMSLGCPAATPGKDAGAGTLGGSCYPNATCNAGLECVRTICVPAEDATSDDATDATTTSDATTTDDAATTGDATATDDAPETTTAETTSDDTTDAPDVDGADAADAGCEPLCEHGGACVGGLCDCSGTGYAGAACSDAICDPICQHAGICQSPDTCDCAGTGFGGDRCQWATPPAETGAWRVAHATRGRLPDNASEHDFGVIDSDGGSWWSIASGLGALDCDLGCVISPDARWLVVVTGTSGRTVSLKLLALDASLQASAVQGGAWTNVADFAFAGGRFFYSQVESCDGAVCQYELRAVTPAATVSQPAPLLTFPPDANLAGSTYAGHFRVSSDGARVALLNTTVRSADLFVWSAAAGLSELDLICRDGAVGACAGVGSEYADTDPLAFDPSGRYLVLFTFSGREQQIRVYDATAPDDIRTSVVASVASGVYPEDICDPGGLADWQWRKVIGDPTFTPDGDEVVFLTLNDCPQDGQPPAKAQTNIYRVAFATLLAGGTLEASDVFDVTRHPKGDVTANRRVSSFSLTPDGATLVFDATPTYDLSGNLVPDGSARGRNDQELYRIRLDGSNAVQLTNDVSYTVESPSIVPR